MPFIVFSDCHRGGGGAGDEFAHNSLIFKCALEYYLKEGFTYIELGDAEELWENDGFLQIYITHTSVYDLLRRFHDPDPARTRYLKVWGNHDEDWRRDPAPLAALFPGIRLHEALALGPILLLHGHQADPVCSGSWARYSRIAVRKFWSRLQRFGICDPTRAAENPGRCDDVDKALYRLARGRDDLGIMKKLRGPDPVPTGNAGHLPEITGFKAAPDPSPITHDPSPVLIVIAGHTHRPVYANLSLTERRSLESGVRVPGVRRKEKAEPVYYNAGSCVHPRCITGIEIVGPEKAPSLTLVKWGYAADPEASATPGPAGPAAYRLHIEREVLEQTGPPPLPRSTGRKSANF